MDNKYVNETSLLVGGACGVYKYLDVPLHCHEQIELIFVAAGVLNMAINGQDFSLTQGDFVVVKSFDLHSFHEVSHGNRYICPIMPSSMSADLINLDIFGTVYHDTDNSLRTIISSHQLYSDLPPQYGSIYFATLAEMLRVLSQHQSKSQPTDLASQVMGYINANFASDIHLCDVTRHCNTNANYASNIIKEATSLTLPSYLNRLRLSAFVGRCTRNVNIKIDSLIREVGFGSPRTFYRAFQREFHMTPQDFISHLISS